MAAPIAARGPALPRNLNKNPPLPKTADKGPNNFNKKEGINILPNDLRNPRNPEIFFFGSSDYIVSFCVTPLTPLLISLFCSNSNSLD